jgi:hypothetical protein
LIAQTGNPLSSSYYLMFSALLNLAALIAIQQRSRGRERTLALAASGEFVAPRHPALAFYLPRPACGVRGYFPSSQVSHQRELCWRQ